MPKNWMLALMCGVVAMTVLDLSVVNVALPSIQTDLDAKPADLQWVVVIYGVLVAGFLMLGSRTGDILATARWASSAPPGAWPRSRDRSSAACWCRGQAGNGCSSSTCRSARCSRALSWHAVPADALVPARGRADIGGAVTLTCGLSCWVAAPTRCSPPRGRSEAAKSQTRTG